MGSRTASLQTKNYYLGAFKSFARWAVRDGRLPQSSVEHLRPIEARKVKADQRHERRASTVVEVSQLLHAAHAGTDWRWRQGVAERVIPGEERAVLYRVAVETGLRASELRSLTPASFDLDADEPTVTVRAAYTKSREEATPLPSGQTW